MSQQNTSSCSGVLAPLGTVAWRYGKNIGVEITPQGRKLAREKSSICSLKLESNRDFPLRPLYCGIYFARSLVGRVSHFTRYSSIYEGEEGWQPHPWGMRDCFTPQCERSQVKVIVSFHIMQVRVLSSYCLPQLLHLGVLLLALPDF